VDVSDNVGVTLVNVVISRGIFNGVVNINFGTCNFTPNEGTGEVDLDLAVSLRLRMDLPCARQLYESLGSLLAGIDQANAAPPPPPEGITTSKPN
jgi:hypothetical protein